MSLVAEFHRKYQQPCPTGPPVLPEPDLSRLRLRLIKEEYEEVREEMEKLIRTKDPDEAVRVFRLLLKELCDLRYVVEGTAVAYGLPFEEAYAEVHASNMTKTAGPLGGKAIKGPEYRAANVDQFVPDITTVDECCAVCGAGPNGRCDPPDDYESDCPHGCSPER